ncbi:MAG: hypothetical protein U1D35_07710 [Paracoccaceae bacterium]|nr:hypothetical protein [Paracoccaceae bacterium]
MQNFRPIIQDAALVGWGVRVMLLAAAESAGADAITSRLAGFGGLVERETELFTALEALIDDPAGYGLFVMECEGFGGLEMGQKAFAMLGQLKARLPVILVAQDCGVQVFPEDRSAPVQLRAPLSAVALRVGFEHALRERLLRVAA